MIEIRVTRDTRGEIVGIRVSGHSGFAPAGRDIVCAAVSAVVQTGLEGVTAVAGCAVRKTTGEALIEAEIPPPDPRHAAARWDLAQAILETMILGLKGIEDGRERHVRVEDCMGGAAL